MKTLNPLETLLYETSVLETRKVELEHPYERGIFISFNNYKSTDVDIYQSLRRIYQSISKCLLGEKLSRGLVKISAGKVPPRQTVMDVIAKKNLLIVAGIHNYDQFNNKTFSGSYAHYGYQHLHLYVYGAHHYLDPKNPNIKLNYLKSNYLNRYLGKEWSKRDPKDIDIRPVGIGKYLYTEAITPTSLYDYLMTPYEEPLKECCINYIADSQKQQYPLSYLYRNTS